MFKSLFIIQWKSMFAGGKSRQGKGNGKSQAPLLMGLLFLLLLTMSAPVVWLFQTIAKGILPLNMEWVYWVTIAVISVFFGVISSVFATYQMLFTARDSELLLAMPIPPRVILGVKVLNLYLLNLLVQLVLMILAVIGYILAGGTVVSAALALGYSLLLPLICLSFTILLAALLSLIVRYIPFKNFFIFFFSLAGMGAYYYFILVSSDKMEELLMAGIALGEAFGRWMPPLYSFGMAIQYRSVVHLALYVLWMVVPFGLVVGGLSFFFRRLMTKKEATIRVTYKGKIERRKPLYIALVEREIRRLFSFPMVLLNSGMGILGSIFFMGILIVRKDLLVVFLSEYGDMVDPVMLSVGVGVLLTLFALSNGMSASSLSLEGQQLWNLKSLPIRSRDILLSKAAYAFLLNHVPILIATLVYGVLFPVPAEAWPVLILLPLTAEIFASLLGIYLNVNFPKLVWQNETVAVKQSLSVFLHMLVGFATIGISIFIYLSYLREHVPVLTFAYALSATLAVLGVILFVLITTKGVKLLDQLDA